MSSFVNITANTASIKTLNSGGTTPIDVNSNLEMSNKNILNVKNMNFQESLDILYDQNYNTLALKATNSQYRGIVYDNFYNRPYEQILPLSNIFNLPSQINSLLSNIVKSPSTIYLLNATQNTIINLPNLPATVQYQNIHLRFSNDSSYLITFTFNNIPIIQIGYERASFLWKTDNGVDFYWVYVP